MDFEVRVMRRAIKDLAHINPLDSEKLTNAIEKLKKGLAGDIKKLTNFSPEYRLRVGGYRVLFDVDDNVIVVYRVLPRKDAYRD